MKEERVSFETAKLFKEKGFSIKTTHFYVIGFKSMKEDRDVRQFSTPMENEQFMQLCKIGKGQPHLAQAPTQALLQRFIREKHKLHILPELCYKSGGDLKYRVLVKDISDGINIIYKSNREFRSYEEALEKGLYHTLKTIK